MGNYTEQLNKSLESNFTELLNKTLESNLTELLNGTLKSNDTHYFNIASTFEYRLIITIVYTLILVIGIIGNVSTCVVVARNRYMHTATNYYLFSLAVSDLLLLIVGLPQETYNLWFPDKYLLGEAMCVILGLASETSANATVLTITAFTVERYIAICHPFLSHTMSKLSRVVRSVAGIWLFAFCTAIPQAIQFGIVKTEKTIRCTLKRDAVDHAFEISGFIFFVGPMTAITVLYALIGLKLRTSRVLHPVKKISVESSSHSRSVTSVMGNGTRTASTKGFKNSAAQRRVIRMLVAVALSFFVCWAPFHAQRLMAMYGQHAGDKGTSGAFNRAYDIITHLSGVLYYLSTAINPFLYNLMSNKFREAFRATLAQCCGGHPPATLSRTYSALNTNAGLRYNRSSRNLQMTAARMPKSRHSSAGSQLTAMTEIRPSNGRDALARRLKLALASPSRSESAESARSISNSSLRDLDDEYTGEELATYMLQINGVIDGVALRSP